MPDDDALTRYDLRKVSRRDRCQPIGDAAAHRHRIVFTLSDRSTARSRTRALFFSPLLQPSTARLRSAISTQHSAAIRIMPFPRLWTHLRLSAEMIRHRPDLLFVPAHVLPVIHPRRSVVTVHDLGYLYFPEAHPPRQRWYLDRSTRWHARTAAHLLADSAATKRDLIEKYHANPDKITVAYPGLDPSVKRVDDPNEIARVKAKYHIDGDYLLYLGTIQPRKNLQRLIAAFFQLPTCQPPTAHCRQARLVFRATSSAGERSRQIHRLCRCRRQKRPALRRDGVCLSIALRRLWLSRPRSDGVRCARLVQQYLFAAGSGR